MARPPAPLWLAKPSRFAGFSRHRAQIVLALLAALLGLCLTALIAAGPAPISKDPANRAEDQADVVLYDTIVSGVRNGGDYYEVAANAQRRGNYPLRPFVTFRLPTLALLQAAVPRSVTIVLLFTLAALVGGVWWLRLVPAFKRPPPVAVALILLFGGMAAFVQPSLAPFHEVWAGLLIALALGVRSPNHWVEAAAIGMIAMLIRETAALFVIVMAAMALLEGRWRETVGWGATLIVFALVVAAHAYAVSQVVTPTDPASPGWVGMLGFGFFVKTMSISTALSLAPAWLAALLVGLSLFGWAAWNQPIALRALAMFAAYALLLSLFGRPDTFYWGLLIAPTILVGLAFVPDALRDLVAAALDTRRITVTRRVQ